MIKQWIGGRELAYYKLIEGPRYREIRFTYWILKVWGTIYIGMVSFVTLGTFLLMISEDPGYVIAFIILIGISISIGLVFFTIDFRVRRVGETIIVNKRGSFMRRSSYTLGPDSIPMLQGRDVRLTARIYEKVIKEDVRRYEPRIQYLENRMIRYITLIPGLYLLHLGGDLLLTKRELIEISIFLDIELIDSDEMGGSILDHVKEMI